MQAVWKRQDLGSQIVHPRALLRQMHGAAFDLGRLRAHPDDLVALRPNANRRYMLVVEVLNEARTRARVLDQDRGFRPPMVDLDDLALERRTPEVARASACALFAEFKMATIEPSEPTPKRPSLPNVRE